MLNSPHSAEPSPPMYKDPGTLKLNEATSFFITFQRVAKDPDTQETAENQ